MSAAGLLFCRMVVGFVFALSAMGKLTNSVGFQEAIADFQLLPKRWNIPLSWAFLAGEIGVMVMLMAGQSLLIPGFVLAIALLTIFSIGLALVLQRKLRVACNCFGRTNRPISRYDVVRNILILCLCLGGIWLSSSSLYNLSFSEVVLIVLMASCCVAIVTNLSDVIETVRQPFQV